MGLKGAQALINVGAGMITHIIPRGSLPILVVFSGISRNPTLNIQALTLYVLGESFHSPAFGPQAKFRGPRDSKTP